MADLSSDRDTLRADVEKDRDHLRTSHDRIAEFLGEAAALGAYADIVAPECGQQIGRVKAKASEFAAVGDDLQDLAIKIAEFYALARDAGANCQGISDALGGF